MSSHYVYVIVNKINLKLYFGSHSWDGEGLDPDYYGSGKLIKRAVNKYGKDNFIVYPIQFYNTVEECRKAEEELLTKYDVANNIYCYNIKNASVGWTSEDMKGKNNPLYGKRGKDSPLYGRHHTEETRNKMSEAQKGEKHHYYGKHLSEEHRKKLSQAHKGKKHTDETRKKLSESKKGKRGKDAPMYGKHHTDAARSKMIQSKKYLMTPIVAIDKNGKVKIFESQRECARQLNLNPGHIYQCLKGKCKTCKGYTFKYIEQLESGIYEGIL